MLNAEGAFHFVGFQIIICQIAESLKSQNWFTLLTLRNPYRRGLAV